MYFLMLTRILHSYCYASVQVTYGVLDICNWIRAPCSHLKVWKTIAFSSGNIYFCFSFAKFFLQWPLYIIFHMSYYMKKCCLHQAILLSFLVKKQTTWIYHVLLKESWSSNSNFSSVKINGKMHKKFRLLFPEVFVLVCPAQTIFKF